MISILWSRLGTKLPKDFTRADGSRYDSGTEYEFEEAIEGFKSNGKPDLLVYRKMAPPSVRLDDEKELMERLEQKKKLDFFVDKWFHDKAEGTLKAAFHAFESPSDFEELVENHLRKIIERKLPRSQAATTEAKAVWKKGSPFRGLAAFHFEHAPVFFGRTKAVSDILQALRNPGSRRPRICRHSRHERWRQIFRRARAVLCPCLPAPASSRVSLRGVAPRSCRPMCPVTFLSDSRPPCSVIARCPCLIRTAVGPRHLPRFCATHRKRPSR